MDPAEIRLLEHIADRAWPAREVVRGHDWEARFADGMHRRLNSATVWAADDLAATVRRLEDWYRTRGHSAIFKLTDASDPGLDDHLAGLGYLPDARVTIMTADLPTRDNGHVGAGVERAGPTREWADAFAAMSGYGPDRRRMLTDVLDRIELPAAYAAARVGSEIVSAGMAVAEDRHAGVFEMVTHPDHRGRGLAGAVLTNLLEWMRRRGTALAYLQVFEENRTAERLYRRAGFVPRYQYWYRVRPDRLSASPR